MVCSHNYIKLPLTLTSFNSSVRFDVCQQDKRQYKQYAVSRVPHTISLSILGNSSFELQGEAMHFPSIPISKSKVALGQWALLMALYYRVYFKYRYINVVQLALQLNDCGTHTVCLRWQHQWCKVIYWVTLISLLIAVMHKPTNKDSLD